MDDIDPDLRVREFLQDPAADSASFIARVYSNLGAGRVRLIFFADRIPEELQRIVDFLSRNLREEVEVFAFELKRFKGGGFETHVPRVVGANPRVVKNTAGAGPRHQWTKEEFFSAAAQLAPQTQQALRQAFELSTRQGFRHKWGTGKSSGSLSLYIPSISQNATARFTTAGSAYFTSGGLGSGEAARWAAAELCSLARSLFGDEAPPNADSLYEFSIDEERWVPAAEKIFAKLAWIADEAKARTFDAPNSAR
jgi:hypothetical protein